MRKGPFVSIFALLFSASFSFGQDLSVDPPRTEAFQYTQSGDPEVVWMRFGQDDSAEPVQVRINVVDDMVILDGDIILGVRDEVLGGRAAILDLFPQEWPNSTIPFTIEKGYPDVNMLYLAINHIINKTNICMVPRTTEVNYVQFVNSTGCSSYVGMIGGRQNINVAQACGVGSTIHEILHAAGHWHEQSRLDRDDYVVINYDNISPSSIFNFDIYSLGADVNLYDYSSIMHYSPYAFSFNGQTTIDVKMPPGTPSTNIGQRVGLSTLDVIAVNEVYMAAPSCDVVQLPGNLTCKNLGELFINGSNVYISGSEVQNDGSVSMPAALAYFYYLVGNTAYWFGQTTIPALEPGESHLLDLSANLSAVDDGTYQIGIWINPYQEVMEVNYGDNFCSWNYPQLTLPAPDGCAELLTVSDNPASGSYQAGGTLETSGNVQVTGSADFLAGTAILLKAGFHAQAGSDFNARIVACVVPFKVGPVWGEIPATRAVSVTAHTWKDQELKVAPNPFSGQTTITFSLTAPDKLDIAVFDVNGRQMEQPAAGRQFEAGEHRMVYDGRQLQAGVYVLVVRGQGYFGSARMIAGW